MLDRRGQARAVGDAAGLPGLHVPGRWMFELRNDCNSSVACGTGTCIQDQHGFWPCNYANTPTDHICEGEVFSQPVECCGIGFTNNSTSLVVTCPAGSGRECCAGLLGAQCCQPGVKCKLGGCGTPIIDVG